MGDEGLAIRDAAEVDKNAVEAKKR